MRWLLRLCRATKQPFDSTGCFGYDNQLLYLNLFYKSQFVHNYVCDGSDITFLCPCFGLCNEHLVHILNRSIILNRKWIVFFYIFRCFLRIVINNFSISGTNCKLNAIPFKNNHVTCGTPRIEFGRFIIGTNNLCVRIMFVRIIKYRAFVFSGFSLPWKKQICVEYQYKYNSCRDNYYSSKKIRRIIWLRSTGVNSGFSYPHLPHTIFPLGRIALHFSQ